MELTSQATNLLLSYIVLQETFLGDLIPKGEKCGSKQGMFPKKEKYIPKGEKCQVNQVDIGWW